MPHLNLTPLMQMIVPITVMGNLILLVMLLFNEHYRRLGVLVGSCVYSVIADPILQRIHLQAHGVYAHALLASQIIVFILNILIVAESWWIGERRVRTWVEIQILADVIALLLKHEGYLWANYYTNAATLLFSMVMLYYFSYIFRSPYEPSRAREKPL